MKKAFTSLVISLLLTLTPLISNAGYIYSLTNTEPVNNAITYEERQILTENGWIRAYIAYVDVTDPNAAIKVMTSSNGCSYLSTVRQMAQENGADLAVNGDFFNFSSGQTNMLGMTYKDGELISTPALDNLVSFVLTDSNQVIMDYFSFTSTAISPQGYSHPIYQINKMPVNTGGITMLTSEWAKTTVGVGYKELLVENDIVVGINEASSPATAMPQNGYILVTNPSINGFLDNFQIGDKVTVQTNINPHISGIKEATGGNTLIVADGKVSNFTGEIKGYAQRTAIGVKADGKTVILLAVDGRQEDCRGLTQTELANLMIELGAYRAINADGGGSTTFVSKNPDGSYEVENSVTSERKVATSIGVFAGGLEGTHAASGEIIPSQSTVISGDSVSFDVRIYDEYRNLYANDASKIILKDELGNPVDFQNYVPTPGSHTVYAQCENVVVSADINVVDSLFAIELSEETLNLAKGQSAYLDAYGYDNYGRRFKISPHLLEWIGNDNASVQNGTVTSLTGASTVIGVKYQDKMDFISLNKSVAPIKAPPAVYGKDELYGSLTYGQKIAVSGNVPKGATLLNRHFSRNRVNKLAGYNASFVTAAWYDDLLPQNCLKADKYSANVYGETLFVTVNNSSGAILPKDWGSLAVALSTQLPNIVVVAEKPLEKMNERDRVAFKALLEYASSYDKNVFFLNSGETTEMKIENNVRYITCGTVADYLTTTMDATSKSCPYVVFSVSGSEIKFEFVK